MRATSPTSLILVGLGVITPSVMKLRETTFIL